MAATEVLWMLSGRQYGTCEVTLRPCREDCAPVNVFGVSNYYASHWAYPYIWYTTGCAGGCMGMCSCNTVHRFTLPQPISSIVEIIVDGEVVPTGSYRVDNYRYVVRTDGEAWPRCNDLSINEGPGAWSSTVIFGAEVPEIAKLAVGELGCEFIKALTGNKDCRLPKRVQSLTRQGVTMAFLDPQEFLNEGKTGFYIADLFLTASNPNRLQSGATFHSPDVPDVPYRTF